MNKIDKLVKEVRKKYYEKIQYQCGTMRMLDIAKPIELADIYTDVYVLEEIPREQRRDICDLIEYFKPESEDFDRLGLSKRQKRWPGLNAIVQHKKLMVLGKPGSGKTTFLQWVAINCNLGNFEDNKVPIFIRLKNFAEDTREDDGESRVLNYITKELANCGIADRSIIKTILDHGRALILLDGLDEVSDSDREGVIKDIRRFVTNFFKNNYIITCRIAANRYNFREENFADVEVADFTDKQVAAFANKWFTAVAQDNLESEQNIARKFLKNLDLPENKEIKELAVTPILLNLTCLYFKDKLKFPLTRSKMYEEGLEILLRKWDENRNIKRDKLYRNLSLEDKINLLMQIASENFLENRYFFTQSKIEEDISKFLSNLPKGETKATIFKCNSEVILKSIEAQHGLLVERAGGIYSFSHLTFQEYFTAKSFVNNPSTKMLEQLISGLRGGRWREIFLLSGEMLCRANEFQQLKKCIDNLVVRDQKIQQFLDWVQKKSSLVRSGYKLVAVRALYIGINLPSSRANMNTTFDLGLARRLDSKLYTDYHSNQLNFELAIDLALVNAIRGNFVMMRSICLESYIDTKFVKKIQEIILKVDGINHAKKLKEENLLENIENYFLQNWNELQKIINLLVNSSYASSALDRLLDDFKYNLSKVMIRNYPEELLDQELNNIFKKLLEQILEEDHLSNLVTKYFNRSGFSYSNGGDYEEFREQLLNELETKYSKYSTNFYIRKQLSLPLIFEELYQKWINFKKNIPRNDEISESEYVLNLNIKELMSLRNIYNNWELSEDQKEILNKYYDSNRFLIECLNRSDLSVEVKQEIEDTLLLQGRNLPVSTLERQVSQDRDESLNRLNLQPPQPIMNYLDFQLLVTADKKIRASSEQGEDTGELRLDMNKINLSLPLIEFRRTNTDLLKALGGELYQALFPPKIHSHLRATIAGANAHGDNVRLRLIFESPELAALPWEFLYDESTNTFLGNNTQTVLSRYIDIPLQKRDLKAASKPLKILLVISHPTDLRQLDVAGEERLIRGALEKHINAGNIELDVLQEATIRNINQKLREPYNVFHFIGHGEFKDNKGFIALVDDNNKAKLLDEESFANFFLGNRNLGLAVLNSCQGAEISSNQAFAGLSPNLVRRGIPAVVAMKYSILDKTAKLFADEFYRTLALGWPVDAAIQTTRNAISIEVGQDKPDFATPVLYMRSKDGIIMSGL